MEGLGGEDVLATAMSAISLAAEKVSKTDLVREHQEQKTGRRHRHIGTGKGENI
jgi:hypothetical protein